LDGIYGQFPAWPLDAFNGIASAAPLGDTIPARPLSNWDATYQGWFEPSFDYHAHGEQLGLNYPDALHFFTDLAHIRDETMALWVARGLESHPHLLVVAGDWHVQTRLAVPDRVARLKPNARLVTITTAPSDHLDEVRNLEHAGRHAADYII